MLSLVFVPVKTAPVDVGNGVEVANINRLVPEGVLWVPDAPEATVPTATGWMFDAAVPCVVTEAVDPELIIGLGLADCGVAWPAGTSVALMSGRAMDMRESRRSSFSVSKELRLITGWDSMFIN